MSDDALCAFAVGSAAGPRSAIYRLRTEASGCAVRVSARVGGSPFELTVLLPPAGSAPSDRAGARPTRESLRSAVASGTWAATGTLVGEWPGEAVAAGAREQLSVGISGSALRTFAEPPGDPQPAWIRSPPDFGHVAVKLLVLEQGAEWRPGPETTVLGRSSLPDGREVVAASIVEDAASPLQKAGLFAAIRKRRPPDLPQEVLVRPDARIVLVWQLGGRGMWTEIAGDVFTTPGSC